MPVPGDVGLVAKLVQVIFSWATDEDGLRELLLKKKLANKRSECAKALADNRFDDLKRLTAELERLSQQP